MSIVVVVGVVEVLPVLVCGDRSSKRAISGSSSFSQY